MAVGVGIGEKTPLKHFVSRSFNSWDEVARGECDLLDVLEVVSRVSIESESADRLEGVIGMGPDLGNV